MKKSIVFIFLLTCSFTKAQEVKTETHWLENTEVKLQHIKYGTNAQRAVYLNLHENESTSVEAAKIYLENRNGFFLGVQQNGERNISFSMKGTPFQFDPNRIFSKKGRIETLKLLNKKYLSSAEEVVEEFSDKIIRQIRDAKIIIALHNNTEGNLSVRSFSNRYINPAMDPDNFILTTEKKIYDQLKAKKINAVLQTASTSTDDGSLSIFCSKKKIAYINIEAQHGHKTEQLRMLNALTDIIDQYTR